MRIDSEDVNKKRKSERNKIETRNEAEQDYSTLFIFELWTKKEKWIKSGKKVSKFHFLYYFLTALKKLGNYFSVLIRFLVLIQVSNLPSPSTSICYDSGRDNIKKRRGIDDPAIQYLQLLRHTDHSCFSIISNLLFFPFFFFFFFFFFLFFFFAFAFFFSFSFSSVHFHFWNHYINTAFV